MKKFSALLTAILCSCLMFPVNSIHAEEPAKPEVSSQQDSMTGELVIATSNTTEEAAPILQAFEAQYPGLTVTLRYMPVDQAIEQLKKDENPGFDLLWGGTSYDIYAPHEELWQPYSSKNLALSNPLFQNKTGSYTNYALYGTVFLESDNFRVFKQIQADSYKDLLNLKLEGRIAMGNPAASIPAYNNLAGLLAANGGQNSDEAWAYAKELSEIIDGMVSQSAGMTVSEVAKHKMAVGLTSEKQALDAIENQKSVIEKENYKQEAKERTIVYLACEGFMECFDNITLVLADAWNPKGSRDSVVDLFHDAARHAKAILEDELLKASLTTRKQIRFMRLGPRTLQIIYPEEGSVWIPSSAAIVKNAAHKEEAQLFIDYLLSDDAQILLSGLNLRGVNTDIEPVNPLMKPWNEIHVLETEDLGASRKEDAKRWNELIAESAANDVQIQES